MTALLLAEFTAPDNILNAARATRRATTYRVSDAFTPLPVEGLVDEIDTYRPSRIRRWILAGGLVGAVVGVFLQWYSATVALPVMAGGRALASWPDFFFAVFELTILGAALAGFVSLLVGSGLPRLHHPLFDVAGFERATQDRFFLQIALGSPEEIPAARAYLRGLGAVSVSEVPS